MGRERELATATRAWAAAAGGRRAFLLISGEGGIGKTRLATEVAGHVAREGGAAYWGSGWESGGAPPLWPWIQVLRRCLEVAAAADARHRVGAAAALIDEMVLSSETRGIEPHGYGGLRFPLFDAIDRFLHEICVQTPIALVLDDIHVADPTSIELLDLMVRGRPDSRLLFVVTLRPERVEPDSRLSEVLEAIRTQHDSVDLRGLPEPDVRRLAAAAGADLSAGAATTITAATGGNPLFVKEVARSMLDEGVEDPSRLIPAARGGIGDTIRRRLASMPEDVVDLLRSASVIGRHVPVDLLVALSEQQPEVVQRLLHAATDVGLMRASADARVLSFVHDLVRTALYEALDPDERARSHARVAEILRGRNAADDDPDLLAHHLGRGGPELRREAVDALLAAGEASLRRFAYEAAAARLDEALALATQADERRCDVLISLAAARGRTGDRSTRTLVFEAADLAMALGDGDRVASALVTLASVIQGSVYVQDDELILRVSDALERMPPGDLRLRARLLAALVFLRPGPENASRRWSAVDEALAVSEELGDDLTRAEVLRAAVGTYFYERRTEQHAWNDDLLKVALRLQRSSSAAIQLRGRELEVAARRANTAVLLEAGDLAGFEREAAATIRGAQELGQPRSDFAAECLRSVPDHLAGRWDEVERRAAGYPDRYPGDMLPFIAYVVQTGFALYEQDRLDELEPLLRDLLRGMPTLPGIRLFLGFLALQRQRPEEARATLGPIIAGMGDLPVDAQWTGLMSGVVTAMRLLGDAEGCATAYRMMAPHKGQHVVVSFGQASTYLGAVDLYLGMAAATAGQLDRAVEHLEDALAEHRRLGAAAWVARAEYELASAIVAGGTAPGRVAENLARDALAIVATLPMAWLERQIRALLETRPVTTEAMQLRLTRRGDVWSVEGRPSDLRVKHMRGLEYLAKLVASPGSEIHVTDLLSAGGEVAPAGTKAAEDDLHVERDVEPVLDERAMREYRRRIVELQEEVDDATACNDPERAARARAELDLFLDELRASTGLAGRSRSFADPVEKARISVTKAIKRAIDRIAAHDRDLGDHLEASVSTGVFCSYRPTATPR